MTLPINQLMPGTNGNRNISIVTRVRNRRAHLVESLPTWLKLPVHEIIVVDYGSDEPIADYCAAVGDDRVKCIRVEADEFNRSRAWNIGITQATAEWVFLLDADVKVTGNLVDDPMFTVPTYDNFFRFYADKYLPNLFGCGIVLKDAWERAGGFNEHFTGWGWEDVDFYKRLSFNNREVTLSPKHFEPIAHDNEARTAGHKEKDLRVSVARNAYLARNVTKIELGTALYGESILGRGAVPIRHHWQRIDYKGEHWRKVAESPEFAEFVKRYNVWDEATAVAKLFDMPEFKQLERRFDTGLGSIPYFPNFVRSHESIRQLMCAEVESTSGVPIMGPTAMAFSKASLGVPHRRRSWDELDPLKAKKTRKKSKRVKR